MNDRQENKLRMYRAVQSICSDNQNAWASHIVFSANFRALQQGIGEIENRRKMQEMDTSGFTEGRDAAKEAMARKAEEIAGAITVYADEQENDALLKKTDFSFTELFRVRDSVARSRAGMVLDASVSLGDALRPYGVSAAGPGELKKLIKAFDEALNRRLAAPETRQTATSDLAETFAEVDTHLRRMDRLMPQFAGNREFFVTYFNAREISDLRGRRANEDDAGSAPASE